MNRTLSGAALKRIAAVCMLLDHIGASCLEVGLMARWPNPTGCATFALLADADPAFAPVYYADLLLRAVGRLSFPLYCFLLAEGAVHTRSLPRYAGRLAVFALLSELPFDLAFFASPAYLPHQNVYFTLLLGLCACAWLRRFDPADQTLKAGLARAAGVAACAAAAVLLRCDYDAMGVVLIAVMYAFRAQPLLRDLLAAALLYSTPAALPALVLIHLYSGQRGGSLRRRTHAFY